jgi:hypothetical protein
MPLSARDQRADVAETAGPIPAGLSQLTGADLCRHAPPANRQMGLEWWVLARACGTPITAQEAAVVSL